MQRAEKAYYVAYTEYLDSLVTSLYETNVQLQTENKRFKNLLVEIINEIDNSRKGSIGSSNNVRLPQIGIEEIKRWREAVGE